MTCHRKSHKRTCLPLASSNAPVDRTRKTMDKVKAVGWAVLVVLGLFGVTQRRYLIGRLRSSGEPKNFWWIVVAELAFMGIASGVAARTSAASASASPGPRNPR